MQKNKRRSNIELLRIISMLFILAHHFSVHGGFDVLKESVSLNRIWVQFLQMGGKIGVDIFVIISGYFLISSKGLKVSKILKLLIQLFFYSIIIYFMFVFCGMETLSAKGIVDNCLPLFTKWWFASAYFVLYLLSPYLNRLLNSFSKEEYQGFLVLLTIIWCVIPTFTTFPFYLNPLIWFIYLYALAGYIRLFDLLTSLKMKTSILLTVLISFLTLLSAISFDILGLKIKFFSEHSTYFFEMQKLPILIISILLFLIFSKIDIGSNIVINTIASATFGVYLIHDNNYMREFLWKVIFKNSTYAFSGYLIPYSLFVIFVVYLACTLIELIRIYFIEDKYLSLIDKVSNKVEIKLKKLQDFIYKVM